MAGIKAAVMAVAAIVQADGIVPALAIVAFAAAGVRFSRDTVADTEFFHARAKCDHFTRPFMPHDKGIVGRPIGKGIMSVDHFRIGAADRDGADAAEHLSGTGLGNRQLSQRKMVVCGQRHRFHGFWNIH